jgi:DNA primase
MDAIAYYRAGFANVVATMGVSLSKDHIGLLSAIPALKTVILSFDNDNAGTNANVNVGRQLIENSFNVFVSGKYDKSIKDVDELIESQGKTGVEKIISERVDFISYLIDVTFSKTLPLDETVEGVKVILQFMADAADVLLKTKHLELLSSKSGLIFKDLEEQYTTYSKKEYDSKPEGVVYAKKNNYTKVPNVKEQSKIRNEDEIKINNEKNVISNNLHTLINFSFEYNDAADYYSNLDVD